MAKKKKEVWRTDVPPPVARIIPIYTCKGQDRFDGVILNPGIDGFWTHWHNGRTGPCFKAAGDCQGCEEQWPSRWKGLLLLQSGFGPKLFFLETTPLSARRLLEQVEQGQMRGKIISVQRERRTSDRSPLLLTVIGEYQGEKPLPAAKDPLPSLHRVWGIFDIPNS